MGDAASKIAGTLGKVVNQTLAHGVLSGTISVLNGGDFYSEFASGAAGPLAAWGTGALLTNASDFWYAAGTIASGSLVGGATAELTGGNFFDGLTSSAISASLNHVAHAMFQQKPLAKPKKEKWDLNGDGKLSKFEADEWFMISGGQAITVDNSKIDWGDLKIPKGLSKGDVFGVETHDAFKIFPWETAATYGGTSFKVIDANTVEVMNQAYHYKYRPANSLKNIGRNILTLVGDPRMVSKPSASGKQFDIKYKIPTIKIK